MKVLRTLDTSFDSLPGYEFEPHYVEVPAGDSSNSTLRVHYLDEGPGSSGGASAPRPSEVVVLLHGELSWSYLYGKIVPALVAEGFRVIAADLVGFGRSDKPAARTDYTYARTVEWIRAALFDQLGLEGITLVGHDWGGLVGLRLLVDQPTHFCRSSVLTNTAFPTGEELPGLAFLDYRRLRTGDCTFARPAGRRPRVRQEARRRGQGSVRRCRSQMRATRRAPASSPSSSRPAPTIQRRRQTVTRGRSWASSTERFCAPSATATRSRRVLIAAS